jgi:hypothetical protein
MFGFGKKHDDGTWVAAPAEVLEANQSAWAITTGNPSIVGNTEIRWKLHLRVRPAGEAPFEVEMTASLPQLTHPRPGMMLAVRFDPADHSHIELDDDEGAQAQAALSGIVGRNPQLNTQTFGGSSIADLMQSALKDPNAFRAQMQEQAAAMQADAMRQQAEAMAAAQAAQAQAMAAAQAAQAQATQASSTPSASPAAPGPEDRIVALERLAGLRDRGILTDEEFAAEKARILGG